MNLMIFYYQQLYYLPPQMIGKIIPKIGIELIKMYVCPSQYYLFSENNKYEKLLIAQLSMNYIQTILEKCDLQTGEPLMKRILDVDFKKDDTTNENVKPQNDGAIRKKAKNYMNKLFIQGVKIDYNIFTQARIKNPIQSYSSKLFCFYPNILVTKPVFQVFQKQHKPQFLIYGPYGISKTSSIILYWHFSSRINDYLFQATDEERKAFIRKYPNINVPRKLFYYSINIGWSENAYKKLLIAQCPEKLKQILRKEENYNLPFGKFCNKITDEFDFKNMGCDIIFDQINALVSVFRQYKVFEQQTKLFKINGLDGQKPKDSVLMQLPQAKQALNFVKKMKYIATWGKQIYNSSISIQKEFLGKTTKENPYSLQVQGHSNVQNVLIEYFQSSQTVVGQQELDQIVMKQISRQFSNITFQDLKKDELIEIHQQKGKWLPNIRPLNIFEAVQKFKKDNEGKQKQSIQQKPSQFFKKAFQQIIKITSQQTEKRMTNFLSKNQDQVLYNNKISFFFHLYVILIQRMKQSNQNGQNKKDKKEQIASVTFNELLESGLKQKLDQLEQFVDKVRDKEILSVNKDKNKIIFHISEHQFLQFWNKFTQNNINLFEITLKTFKQMPTGSMGSMFETMIIRFLMENGSSQKPLNLKIGQFSYSIQDKQPFCHFSNINKSEKASIAIQDSIKNISLVINACLNKKGSSVVGYPVTYPSSNKRKDNTPDHTSVYSQNSPIFDFIIMLFDGQKLNLRSFDIGIGNNKSKEDDKFIEKIQPIKNMIQKGIKQDYNGEIKNFKWIHTLLVNPTSESQPKVWPNQIQLRYEGYDKIINKSQYKGYRWQLYKEMLEILRQTR